MITVPDEMRRRAQTRGTAWRDWTDELPGLLGSLTQAWSLTLGEVLDGGKAAYVAQVRTSDGSAAVLKVAPPGDDFASQVRTIEAADGRGYVRLLRYDLPRNAALMEPLGQMLLTTAAASVTRALDVLAATLRQAWQVPRPPGAAVLPGTDKATRLIDSISELWPLLGQPCSRRLIEQAVSCGRRRAAAFDLAACVVCHGDPHPANALAVLAPRPGAPAGYVFVDPDGFLAEPAYDLGVVLRGWTGQVLAAGDPVALLRRYCSRLAAATGVDEQAIWEWGFVERVSSGLYLMRYGHEEEGRTYLASAERLVL